LESLGRIADRADREDAEAQSKTGVQFVPELVDLNTPPLAEPM
jgi:hypothetical protein